MQKKFILSIFIFCSYEFYGSESREFDTPPIARFFKKDVSPIDNDSFITPSPHALSSTRQTNQSRFSTSYVFHSEVRDAQNGSSISIIEAETQTFLPNDEELFPSFNNQIDNGRPNTPSNINAQQLIIQQDNNAKATILSLKKIAQDRDKTAEGLHDSIISLQDENKTICLTEIQSLLKTYSIAQLENFLSSAKFTDDMRSLINQEINYRTSGQKAYDDIFDKYILNIFPKN